MASKSTTRSKSVRRAKCRCGERPDCGPSCTGLECLERPRFFSGQLLTESELNSLEQYVLAKNRLHNLHHHGWGVVCGLEVTCHDCDGWVTVHPGYAIDSCGNDVVVCKPDDFNVMEEIRRCKEARRKDDCYCPPGRKDCDEDREEHWCLTLSYMEKEARPTTALNQEPQRCGCSCGGSGKKGSCGCGGSAGSGSGGCSCGTAGKTERVKAGVGKAPYACEPSRILECYRLELCESEEGACRGRLSSGEQAWIDKFKACFDGLTRSLRGFPRQEAMNLGSGLLVRAGVSSFTGVNAQRQPADVYSDYRRVYDFLRELFRRNPGNLHCAWIDRLEELEDPVPGANDTSSSFEARIEQPASRLMSYLLLYLIDCFCHAMLPPCAPCCPGEDPLVLACMKIRNGKILEICNYSCRRYAGVFPPSLYGVYLGPFLPFLTRIMEIFCCGDFVERLLGQLRTQEWARKLGSFVTADQFANVRSVDFQARSLWAALNREEPEAAKKVTLARFVGRETEIAVREAREAGVEITAREVAAVPLTARVRTLSAARPGERLVAFSQEGRIVGFAAEGSTEAALVEQADELAALRREIESLKARTDAAGTPPAAGKK